MFIPDVQYVESQYQQIVFVDSAAVAADLGLKELKVGVCRPVANADGVRVGLDSALIPVSEVVAYLWKFDKDLAKLSDDKRRLVLDSMAKSAVVSLVEGPKYGVLTKVAEELSNKPEFGMDFYKPHSGDMRRDNVSYFVKIGSYQVKVVYSIIPVDTGVVSEGLFNRLCGRRGEYYKIK